MPNDESNVMHQIIPDVASAAAVLGALVGFLPAIATVFAIIWYVLMIWDWVITHRLKRVPAVKSKDGGRNG